ncbi:MAG: electron transfer flavoprotein subunit beta/FixA family protein [Thermincolia bacterium]
MHMVVCLKQVPDATEVKIDPKTNTLVREGVPAIINPYDIHALEEAIVIKEKYGGRVTVITMGPPMAVESLKKAVSYGADEAILLSDRAFAGSDTLATSYILAQAIKKVNEKEPVDLILCGKQAIDGDTAQVGPGIAVRMGVPQLTFVMKVDTVDQAVGEIQVQRKLEAVREVIRAKLPALLTVEKSLNTIRYASLPNLIRAADYEVKVWGKGDLNLDETQLGLKGSPTKVSRIFAPPQRPGGEVIQGPPEAAVKTLVEKLITRDIIANC